MTKRTVKFYKHHFLTFLEPLSPPVRKKIMQVLVWISTIDRLPASIFKAIEGIKGLYEIRIGHAGNIFRVFCCFDEGQLIILFNGFQKKTLKTPAKEKEKAARLMKAYFDEKANN